MSQAARQARWRNKSELKRIEVYLPIEAIKRLDYLAAERGRSRASVIAGMLQEDGGTPPDEGAGRT